VGTRYPAKLLLRLLAETSKKAVSDPVKAGSVKWILTPMLSRGSPIFAADAAQIVAPYKKTQRSTIQKFLQTENDINASLYPDLKPRNELATPLYFSIL
jgi:hypothetical protein